MSNKLVIFILILVAGVSFALGWFASGYKIYAGMYSTQEKVMEALNGKQ